MASNTVTVMFLNLGYYTREVTTLFPMQYRFAPIGTKYSFNLMCVYTCGFIEAIFC